MYIMCTHTYVHVCTCIHTHVHVCMYTCTHVLCVCVLYIHTYIHMCTCMCTLHIVVSGTLRWLRFFSCRWSVGVWSSARSTGAFRSQPLGPSICNLGRPFRGFFFRRWFFNSCSRHLTHVCVRVCIRARNRFNVGMLLDVAHLSTRPPSGRPL